MSSTFERNSKGHIQRSTKFIAPGHLARTHTHMYGQKSKRILGYSEARRTASDTFLESEDEDEMEVHPNIKNAISAHNIILHFGKHKLEESGFTEDSCFLDILKMCQKFIDIYSVGYEVTNGDGRPLKNDRDVLALFEEHEYVEDIEIYLDIKEAAQPLPFKMPQDNPAFGVISKVPEVKDVFLLGEYKSSKQVTVKGDVIDGTEEASTVEFFIAKDRHFKVDADLQAISECTNNKEFEIPRAAEGHYLVAKFTPKTVDGKSGKPRYAITDKRVEDSTSQKARNARGKNKNKKVATLKSGEKLSIEFYNNRAVGKNHTFWSRHLGKIVRNKHICPVRVQTWKDITDSQKQHMWDAVKECFSNSNMELYREHTLEHMCNLWTAWRSSLNKHYVVPCTTKDEAIKNVPEEMNGEDWNWLVVNKFYTDKFRKISTQNSTNRGNGVMPHRTGSQPHRQLLYEMGGKIGDPLDISSIFKLTRQKKGKFVHPEEQNKYDEIVEIIKSNPSLPPIEVIERSFGPQKHSNVFSFGGGMKRKHLKDSRTAYIEDLEVKLRLTEEENINYKRRMDSLENRIAQIEKNKKTDADSPPTFEKNIEQAT